MLKPYIRYTGSSDVFERATGKYISAPVGTNFWAKIEDIKTPRPGVAKKTDSENIPLSKSGRYYKIGTDVFETATNEPIDLTTFKSLGLNFEFIPKMSKKFAKADYIEVVRNGKSGVLNTTTGEFTPSIPIPAPREKKITEEYLSQLFKTDKTAWAKTFEQKWGKPYEAFFPPTPSPGEPLPPLPPSPPTPPTTVAENIPLSKSGQYYKVGTDVYETATNKKIDLATFKSLGLNFEFIPEKPAVGPLPEKPPPGAPPPSGDSVAEYRRLLEEQRKLAEAYQSQIKEFQEKERKTIETERAATEAARVKEERAKAASETAKAGIMTTRKTQQQSYLDWLKAQTPYGETVTKYREQVGLPTAEKAATAISQEVLDVESLLNKLEGDITSRISGRGISEPLRRRLLASEERPLREQYGELATAQARATAGVGMAQTSLQTLLAGEAEERRRTGETYLEPLRLSAETYAEYGKLSDTAKAELAQLYQRQAQERTAAEKTYQYPIGVGLPYAKEAATFETPEEKAKREYQELLTRERGLKEEKLGVYRPKKVIQPTSPGAEPQKGTTGATYSTRLAQEIANLYSGRYGTEGAREKVIEILAKEFPGMAAQLRSKNSDIYSRVPDGWEAQMKGKTNRGISNEDLAG